MVQPRKVKRAKPLKSAGRFGKLDILWHPKRWRAYLATKEGRLFVLRAAGSVFLVFFLVFLYYAKDLPSPGKINSKVSAQTTKFYDRTGKTLLYEVYGDKNRSIIDFNEMPDTIKHATIAVEDRNFYKHGPFSFLGIIRAAFVDLFQRGSGIQGGSTITQQYVKNALLTPDRSFSRKIKELILSTEIEAFYSKNDILKLYLNEIPYGSNAYGVQAAAKTFFNEDAKQLTIEQAAFLAAIPRAPTYYSPYGQHKDALVARKNLILDLMAQQHYITADEAAAGKKVDTLAEVRPVQNLYANIRAPHFVLWVQEQLEAKYGTKVVTEGGLKVITTLDIDKQEASEKAINDNMRSVRALGGSNAAMVSADPKTGEVYSMVGSYDFGDPKFGSYNVAIADRQPGSSFKPIVYSTAWGRDYNYGPGTTIYDVTTDFGGGYKPKNYSGRNYGVQSMRTALDGSLNIPAVKTLYLAGVDKAIKQAHSMGITTLKADPESYGLSLVLGAGEVKLNDMVNAYSTFANGGVHYQPVSVLKLSDSKGTTLEEYKPAKNPPRVLDPQVAYLMNNVLSDNNARAYIFGANNPLTLPGRPVAAKTGTTEHYNDAWTMGYTPSLVAGAWVGNNDNAPMTSEAVDIAAPIWHEFMVKATAGAPVESFVQPSGIKQVTLDANTGRLPVSGSAGPTRTDIFPSWYKPPTALDSRSAVIDKVSGKLATDCTPPLARETAYSSEIHAEIVASDPAYGRWEPPVAALAASLGYKSGGTLPTDSDNVHHCDDTKPKVDLTATALGGGNYRLKSVVTSGTFTANKLEVSFDGQIISTQQISGSTSYSFDYTVTANGSHTFKATVTDSGLYQAEDTASVNVSDAGTGGSFQGLTPHGAVIGGSQTFTWTPDTSASVSKYELFVDGASKGTSSGTSQTKTIPVGAHSWYVKSEKSNGDTVNQTDPVTFTNTP